MNRQLSEKIEYLNRITSMKNILAQANNMPVFFTLLHEKRSQNSGEKYAAKEKLLPAPLSAD
jgi:hypothetical protein